MIARFTWPDVWERIKVSWVGVLNTHNDKKIPSGQIIISKGSYETAHGNTCPSENYNVFMSLTLKKDSELRMHSLKKKLWINLFVNFFFLSWCG